MVEILLGSGVHGCPFDQRCLHSLEERHLITDSESFLVGHRQGEGLAELRDGLDEAVLAVLLLEDMLLGRGQEVQQLLRSPEHVLVVEAMEQGLADLEPGQHDRDGFLLIDGGGARPPASVYVASADRSWSASPR